MVKKFLLGFGLVALAVASAASSYHITFYQPVLINGSELKAGDYKLEIKDNTAVIKQGKTVAEAPVTIVNENQKYEHTTLRMNGMQLEEIRIGGTSMRISFDKTSNATN